MGTALVLAGIWFMIAARVLFLSLMGLIAGVSSMAVGPFAASQSIAATGLNRLFDPVVLTGADVPWLAGVLPGELVAFRYENGWQPIPVQVDERVVQDLGVIYDTAPNGVTETVYADAETFTGPDPDTTIDDDDEIVFMAKDTGDRSPVFSEPAGVVHDTGVELAISDPLEPSALAYAYLFRTAGSTTQARQPYVDYTFDLRSGAYLDTYGTAGGPNTEDSFVVSPYFTTSFSDRWVNDVITITAGEATGVDILDRDKTLFAPGACIRSEDTFAAGPGAFVVNKSGPVRAIRSYLGANSGRLTQREHVFYAQRQDVRTFLRVHPLLGIMGFFDYSPEALGMVYYNDLNTEGVIIDGDPDTVAPGRIQWELITGEQGSLVFSHEASSSIPDFTYTSYYLDDDAPDVTQCTGDGFAYGSSGIWIDDIIFCTDPLLDCRHFVQGTRIAYYAEPGLTVADAQALHDGATNPLVVEANAYKSMAAHATDVPPAAPDEAAAVESLPATGGGHAAGGGAQEPAGRLGVVAFVAAIGAGVAGAAWYRRKRWLRP